MKESGFIDIMTTKLAPDAYLSALIGQRLRLMKGIQKIVPKEREYMTNVLFPRYKEFIKQTIKDLREDQSGRKWLPDPKNNCGFCAEKEGKGTNHEAFEFITSLLDIATAEFMDSDELLGLLRENNYIKDEEES
jgi:hypothetical protein